MTAMSEPVRFAIWNMSLLKLSIRVPIGIYTEVRCVSPNSCRFFTCKLPLLPRPNYTFNPHFALFIVLRRDCHVNTCTIDRLSAAIARRCKIGKSMVRRSVIRPYRSSFSRGVQKGNQAQEGIFLTLFLCPVQNQVGRLIMNEEAKR
jgi:hypothetical protein